MENISVDGKELFGIITQLEDAKLSINGLGDGLECSMIDDDLEIFERAECLLSDSISILKKITGNSEEAN